jgi:hypothetical protein
MLQIRAPSLIAVTYLGWKRVEVAETSLLLSDAPDVSTVPTLSKVHRDESCTQRDTRADHYTDPPRIVEPDFI